MNKHDVVYCTEFPLEVIILIIILYEVKSVMKVHTSPLEQVFIIFPCCLVG